MNYQDFKKNFQKLPIIFTRDLMRDGHGKQVMHNQIKRWHKRGLILKLKRGLYLLNEADRRINPSKAYIANQLYSPSYVSLEYALGYYDLIPERVVDATSISTKKTIRISSDLGNFIYQNLKPEAFRGFTAIKDDTGLTAFFAEPEKAVVDFIYLNLEKFSPGERDIFEESYRFQNMDSLDTDKLLQYAGCFGSKKLPRVINDLTLYIKEGGAQ